MTNTSGEYTAGEIPADAGFCRLHNQRVEVCPTCGSDKPEVRGHDHKSAPGWFLCHSDSDYSPSNGDTLCRDPFHDHPATPDMTESCGNVFADLGLANADELLMQAEAATPDVDEAQRAGRAIETLEHEVLNCSEGERGCSLHHEVLIVANYFGKQEAVIATANAARGRMEAAGDDMTSMLDGAYYASPAWIRVQAWRKACGRDYDHAIDVDAALEAEKEGTE